MIRTPLVDVRLLRIVPVALLMSAGPAFAVPLSITVPTLTAAPGSTVQVPLDLSASPAGLGITSILFSMPFNGSVVQSSQSLPDGFLQTWGAPFVNAQSTSLAAAAAGSTPVSTSGTRLNSVQLVIKASAVVGTDMPLTFTQLMFNEGTPAVSFTPGVLHIRSGAAVPPDVARGFTLAPAAPSPALASTRLAFTLPLPMHVRLEVFAIDGRRVRTLADSDLPAGAQDRTWDTRDATGHAVAAGVYLARLSGSGLQREARIAVVR